MRNLLFFFRLFIWFSLRHMRKHMGRAATVLFGIALGAAVFTSVRLSVDASLDSFTKSMDLIAGRADHVLTRPGGYVPEPLIAELLKHPMIRSASPVLSTFPRDRFLRIHRRWHLAGIRLDPWAVPRFCVPVALQ